MIGFEVTFTDGDHTDVYAETYSINSNGDLVFTDNGTPSRAFASGYWKTVWPL